MFCRAGYGNRRKARGRTHHVGGVVSVVAGGGKAGRIGVDKASLVRFIGKTGVECVKDASVCGWRLSGGAAGLPQGVRLAASVALLILLFGRALSALRRGRRASAAASPRPRPPSAPT
jgi:hypothetical protein